MIAVTCYTSSAGFHVWVVATETLTVRKPVSPGQFWAHIPFSWGSVTFHVARCTGYSEEALLGRLSRCAGRHTLVQRRPCIRRLVCWSAHQPSSVCLPPQWDRLLVPDSFRVENRHGSLRVHWPGKAMGAHIRPSSGPPVQFTSSSSPNGGHVAAVQLHLGPCPTPASAICPFTLMEKHPHNGVSIGCCGSTKSRWPHGLCYGELTWLGPWETASWRCQPDELRLYARHSPPR